MTTSTDFPTDGRVQRSERSRSAIVGAMLQLIGEGSLSPTAQKVAERADVGVRTVFRHFSDMETLFATMNEQLTTDVESLFVNEVQSGPFTERVDALIERRVSIFGKLAPYVRSSTLQRWRSTFLQQEHERTTRILRRDLRRWLPEVEAAPSEVADALELVLSFEAWNRLRIEQKLGLRRTTAVMRLTILELLREHIRSR
ncbi:MAG: TetR/AcrR family transcriptional regulator [Myxococcales bacterium]|nr:TetR/AcrR family transcriptional regulator [Myxococcales bacterium]HIK85716.1 TetR/AcrR family transcriptional regulator [Myxococcales bacterium]